MNMFRRILSTLFKQDELRHSYAHRNLKSTSNISAGKIDCKFNHAVAILADGTIKYTGF